MDGVGKDENGNFFLYTDWGVHKNLTPHRCPVCGGNGLVPRGFYSTVTGQSSTTDATPEICRACQGKGYILA